MLLRRALLASSALALACLGCLPVAHLELADGTLVTFVQPAGGGERLPDEAGPGGQAVRVTRAPCDVSPQVGLAGAVTDREWVEPGPGGRPLRVLRKTLRVTNVSGAPIALKRLLAYAHATEPPGRCDPAAGFEGVRLGDAAALSVRAETPGFAYRAVPLAQPWRIEGGLLVQPLAALLPAPGATASVRVPAALLAPGAEVTVRRLGGGPALATLRPDAPIDAARRPIARFAYGPGLPPMLPLELCFRAADGAPAAGWLLPDAAGDPPPAYALEGALTLDRALAPGESLDFTLRVVRPDDE